jgi:hypothetical protein
LFQVAPQLNQSFLCQVSPEFSYKLSRLQYPIKLPTCRRLDHPSNN